MKKYVALLALSFAFVAFAVWGIVAHTIPMQYLIYGAFANWVFLMADIAGAVCYRCNKLLKSPLLDDYRKPYFGLRTKA